MIYARIGEVFPSGVAAGCATGAMMNLVNQ